jgi:hypothetical protein
MVVYKQESYIFRIRLTPTIISQDFRTRNVHIAHRQEIACSTASK